MVLNGSCHLWYHIGCEKRTHDALRFRPRDVYKRQGQYSVSTYNEQGELEKTVYVTAEDGQSSEESLPNLTYDAILKLPEGAHVVRVNAEKCMVIRLRQGYTLTALTPDNRLRVQYYSERAHLFWEDIVENLSLIHI